MQKQKLHFFTDKNLIFIPFLLLFFLIQTCQAADGDCQPSSCGNIPIIKNPFRLTTDPETCGNQGYNLSCESNTTVLYISSARYYVQEINYKNFTIRLVDDGVAKGNCSSLLGNALSENSFFFMSSYIATRDRKGFLAMLAKEEHLNEVLTLISCRNPVRSAMYMETGDCIDGVGGFNSRYAVIGGGVNASSLEKMCRVDMMTMMAKKKDYGKMPFREIHRQLEYGFELSWHLYECRLKGCLGVNSCYLDGYDNVRCNGLWDTIVLVTATLGRLVLTLVVLAHLFIPPLGAPLVCAFLIYKWRRRHRSAYDKIEEFLQNNNLMPVRYSYSEIKKVTRGFKDKLGEGGFGTVYKGKLRSGSFAAVKMLGKSAAGGGQDFMSEVATIGRIHHANVVRLIGFCSEGTKRALVYEFMPNGSLDKYIFHKQGYVSLSMEQLYHISLGVARGIEYLHSGCAMQILHFDIKPHNILLDEKFNPKVSDFGLAKLYQAGDRVATLTAARGTIGYMAPELFYKNIGSVSYKADVYSFGMLLLEMTGKRNNMNAVTDHSSQVYFPFWVHDQVSTPGTPILVGDATEEESTFAKKMVIVGLWCIQTNPRNRPPMNKVVEMLEGDAESLQLPPRPVLYAGENITKNEEGLSSCVSSYMSSDYSQSMIQSDGH
ncbi:Rust resistance kinase Lr10 [Linum perenne]